MINNLLEKKECHLSFSNFRTKQDVQKRKLGAELVKEEWKVCSAGFQGRRRNAPKFVIGALPERSLDVGQKSKIVSHLKRTDLVCPEAKPINSKAFFQSLENLDNSSIAEHTLKQRKDASKRSSSVFLEVQNIQRTFQRSKFEDQKAPVKLPSDFTKKFKAELLSKPIKQQKKNNPLQSPLKIKSLSHPSSKLTTNGTFDLFVGSYKDLGSEHKFQNHVQKKRANPCFKSSKIDLCDFKINADSPSKFLKSTANTRGTIADNKCMKVTEFTQKLKADLSFNGQKRQNLQIHQFQNGNLASQIKPHSKLFLPLTESFKIDKQKENASLSQIDPSSCRMQTNTTSIPVDNGQSRQKSFLDDKSIKVFTQCSKKLTTELVSKKKSAKQDAYQNSFDEDKFDAKPYVTIPSNFSEKIKTCSLPNTNEEQENVPKKLKIDQSTFNDVSADFTQSNATFKVKKTNILTTFPVRSEPTVLVKKASLESSMFATNLEVGLATTSNIQLINVDVDNEQSFQVGSSRSFNLNYHPSLLKEISSVEFSKLLDSRSIGSKGSNWMQSLKPVFSEDKEDLEDPVLKKKIKNIIPGGMAEQLLKLHRRESTEKAIWNHKIHQNNRKALKTSLCFVLTSISLVEDLVIVKSMSYEDSQTGTDSKDQTSLQHSNLLNNDESKDLVFIIFKRKAFTRMSLKVNDAFRLYQPWQTLHLQSVSHPIILCAYFIDVISRSYLDIRNEVVSAENFSTITSASESVLLLQSDIQSEDATHGDMLFYKRDELVTFSARIQRVWKKEFVKNMSSIASASKYVRYSVLVQVKEGTFHELRLLPDVVPYHWYDVISQGEGKCFRFHNLCVSHRTPLKRDRYLRRLLEAMHQQNGSELMQEFCYQLMFDGSSKIPEEICENGFPDYCPITIEPLQLGLEKEKQERFTCVGKVLLKHKNVFYISDESLLHSSSSKCYTELCFLMTSECTSLLVGSTVLIKEALLEEDSLLIDNYAQLIPLCESSCAYQRLSSENKMKVKLQQHVCLKNSIPFLHIGCEVADIVCIQGEIKSVDESNAFTWLQCSFCLQENLVQDSNLVIYCEDCSKIVPNPSLNVKLEVVVHFQMLPSATVHVQLLSATVKRILQIPEDTCQPQCSVNDILGKDIGLLYCYIEKCDAASDKSIFYLSEVTTS